jgi:Fe-S cluster assembly scaffold protein SufB
MIGFIYAVLLKAKYQIKKAEKQRLAKIEFEEKRNAYIKYQIEKEEKQRLAAIEFEQKRAAYNAKIREERKLKREQLKLKVQQYINKMSMIDKNERKFYISLITAVALIIFIFFTFFRYEYKNDGVIIIKTDRITGSSEIIRPTY